MNNNFLNSFGFGNIDIGLMLLGLLGISILLLILIIVTFVQMNKLKKKYTKFMIGKDGANLEKDIMTLYDDNKYMKLSIDRNREDIKELFKKHKSAFQKIGLVKYDAFTEMGGKLSFALALLDENNNGFIINSVHSSEGCYSYTKSVKDGDSQIALSNEEKVAVERAVNGNVSDHM
ncbi:MAG: DUF4446 family protein [Lachnospiraceae bacterium]|nr:DUF4446 family protein [Lachnospiraceae bacterium]MDE6603511.1 DUF4446 family protein [Lachnospiraceae bacterium]MDE7271967.1 DUF4446 family protein [Lachnospiraceae bacterium]